MAAISREEVAHLARLARLAVNDTELDTFAGQLDVILQAVAAVPGAAHEPSKRACKGCWARSNRSGRARSARPSLRR